jgi:hypothetical protein
MNKNDALHFLIGFIAGSMLYLVHVVSGASVLTIVLLFLAGYGVAWMIVALVIGAVVLWDVFHE